MVYPERGSSRMGSSSQELRVPRSGKRARRSMKPTCLSSARSARPGTTPWSPAGAPIRLACSGRRWMPAAIWLPAVTAAPQPWRGIQSSSSLPVDAPIRLMEWAHQCTRALIVSSRSTRAGAGSGSIQFTRARTGPSQAGFRSMATSARKPEKLPNRGHPPSSARRSAATTRPTTCCSTPALPLAASETGKERPDPLDQLGAVLQSVQLDPAAGGLGA